MRHTLTERSEEFVRFWTERRLVVLSTVRPDRTVHSVVVGGTVDFEAGLARVICSGTSHKARMIAAAGQTSVSVTQLDGRLWSSLQGTAVVSTDPARIAEAVRRYTERYRPPRVNPRRVVVEIAVTKVLGNVV